MNYKVQKVLKDNRKYFIIFIILWLVIDIVLIAPLAVAIANATTGGKFNMDIFLEKFIAEVSTFTSFTRVFKITTIGTFGKATFWMTIVFFVFMMVGLIKSKPKHEFTDIEHGSSDWSNGEQYKILSKNKGIILAENNYLPVDKRGNVNVLVVGRFWLW